MEKRKVRRFDHCNFSKASENQKAICLTTHRIRINRQEKNLKRVVHKWNNLFYNIIRPL